MCVHAEQHFINPVTLTAHRHLLQGLYGGGDGGGLYGGPPGGTYGSGGGAPSGGGVTGDAAPSSDSAGTSDAGSSMSMGKASRKGRGTTPCTQQQMTGKPHVCTMDQGHDA
mgnify:CR=1 FL=1